MDGGEGFYSSAGCKRRNMRMVGFDEGE